MNYEDAWKKLQGVLKEKEDQYGYENNPSFDPVTMGLYAEIKDIQLCMSEIEEELSA